ncbi:GNAT family N-acetyltransferase [Luteipulveratus halotolerans]|uniref:N-acetyltransferase domain-containing protein n=1 Tax=Luteipulveratus halotolerans TaxID=1631356 RepID=A0A0L6CG58_9MICO|nr:GNAT family N-acetyltransferase [Luteipulveratus halotolerans]KNX36498.1 hypothetical protein VV01_03955 [Luteipulveratus halotolerans]
MNDNRSESDLTCALRVGMRIVVRSRLDAEPGSPSLTDTVGELVATSPEALEVRTRRGDVTIERDRVVAAKEVPPAPSRRGRPHLAISMTDLQELMVAGMPPLRRDWLGRWLLRSADGYTGRGNSLLPLGDPGLPLGSAMAEVERWYADRGRPPLVQLFGPVGFAVAEDPIGAWALDHDWQVFQQTLVMTAPADLLAAASAPDVRVEALARPDERWWSGTTGREQEHRATLAAMLDQVDDGAYLVATVDGQVAAIGRAAFSQGWAGVFAVHVLPAFRRRGLARAVMRAAAAEAQTRGVRSAYLQVSADNDAAVGLYRSLGFDVHHEYWYAKPH